MAYDPDKAKLVCSLLAENDVAKSLRQACELADVAPSTFLYWCDQGHMVTDASGKQLPLSEHYARADKIKSDIDFEQLAEENEKLPARTKSGVDIGWVAWNRQRLDNRKWILSKRRPSKYGDRVEHTGTMAVTHTLDRESLIGRLVNDKPLKVLELKDPDPRKSEAE
jgi:hypothetical protein